MKKPEFTREQEDYLVSLLDHWYLAWKDQMFGEDRTHRLGMAKEELKTLLCECSLKKLPDYESFFKSNVERANWHVLRDSSYFEDA